MLAGHPTRALSRSVTATSPWTAGGLRSPPPPPGACVAVAGLLAPSRWAGRRPGSIACLKRTAFLAEISSGLAYQSLHPLLLSKRSYSSHLSSSARPVDSTLAARLRLLLRRRPRLLVVKRRPSLIQLLGLLALFVLASTASYNLIPETRHFAQAILRGSRLLTAVAGDVVEYKRTFGKEYASEEERAEAISACHRRSAIRLLRALEKLGGIYIKLGQHLASAAVIPLEWSETMAVLQDRCPPSPMQDIDAMLLKDTGKSRELYFSDWDPVPIGTASIAQVHLATDRQTGQRVAVKLQHPNLEEWFSVDLATVNFAVRLVEWLEPSFEFGWLAKEMDESLPLEMDFRVEATNAARTIHDFEHMRHTSLYVPEVKWVEKRILVMEYISGARVDDLEYLAEHSIDRNLVSKELSRIFSQMVYINGFFHADPHQGNVLIRPRPATSRSPHNFEIVLLDHGQYFSLDPDIRVAYAKFWLSLIAPNSPDIQEQRKSFAKSMGCDESLYPILESALTGRVGLGAEEGFDVNKLEDDGRPPLMKQKAGSVLDMGEATEFELEHMRRAMVEREGLLADIFSVLRSVPRRIIMVLKLNDLTRGLDRSLATTHGPTRVFLIVARYCLTAVHEAELAALRQQYASQGVSLSLLYGYLRSWASYRWRTDSLRLAEAAMDTRGWIRNKQIYIQYLFQRGQAEARRAAAGLPPIAA